MNISSFFRSRFFRLIILIGAGCVVLYGILAFFAFSPLLKPYAERKIGELLESNVTIGAMEFHPFRLAVTVNDMKVARHGRDPWLSWDSLYVNAQLASLFTLSICLDEFRIYYPQFAIHLEKDTPFFSKDAFYLAKTFVTREKIPAIYVKQLAIHEGSMEFQDKRLDMPKQLRLTPISFSLEEFSTNFSADYGNRYHMEFSGPQGGIFRWNGSLQLFPFKSEGEMEIQRLNILQFRDFYRELFPFELSGGELNFNTGYRIFEEPEAGFVLEDTRIRLNSLRLTAMEDNAFAADIGVLLVDSLRISSVERYISMSIATVDSASFRYAMLQLPKISSNILDFLRYNSAAADSIMESSGLLDVFLRKASNLPRWQFRLDSLQLKHASLTLTDSTMSPATLHSLDDIQGNLSKISNSKDNSVQIQLSARMNESGNLNFQGDIHLFPLSANGNITLNNYPLISLQNYISQKTWLGIRQGEANAQFALSWYPATDSLQNDSLTVSGNLDLENIRVSERNGTDFLNAKQISVKELDAELLPQHIIEIGNIHVRSPAINIIKQANGEINLSKVLKIEKSSSAMKPLHWNVKQARISGANANITDKDSSSFFQIHFTGIQSSLRNLSDNSRRKGEFTINGKVGGYAPFSVNGWANLSGKHPQLHVELESANQDLTLFSPYSGKYAGYKIAKGQVTANMDYLVQANKVHGKNHIVIQQLTFGDEVKSEEATNLPVRLGAALLSDKNGVIDLDVAIEGDMNDPEFNIAGLIWKMIKNLLGKAAAAPLKSLMALMDSEADPEIIAFDVGSDLVDSAKASVLRKLSEALSERPLLQLEVHGNADPLQDGNFLKERQLIQEVTRNLKRQPSNASDMIKLPLRDTLFAYYQRTQNKNRRTLLPQETADFAAKVEYSEDSLVETALKIWQELLASQELPPNTLENLAHQRAQNIKIDMMQQDSSLGKRIFVAENEYPLSAAAVNLKILVQ